MLEEIHTDTKTYKFGTTDLNFTLCLNKEYNTCLLYTSAKAVALVAKYGGSITEYEGGDKVPGPVDTIIAIPTTAGTGSEVTTFSVITDHTRNYKLSVFSFDLLPK